MLTQAKRRTMAGVTLALVVFAGWQLLGWGGQEVTHIARAVGAVIASSFAFASAVTAGPTWSSATPRSRRLRG